MEEPLTNDAVLHGHVVDVAKDREPADVCAPQQAHVIEDDVVGVLVHAVEGQPVRLIGLARGEERVTQAQPQVAEDDVMGADDDRVSAHLDPLPGRQVAGDGDVRMLDMEL